MFSRDTTWSAMFGFVPKLNVKEIMSQKTIDGVQPARLTREVELRINRFDIFCVELIFLLPGRFNPSLAYQL